MAGSEGGWQVDWRCTNCDVARQLAPDLIAEVDGQSVVVRQPRGPADLRRLSAAAHACPTRSIRPPDGRLDPALDPFPMALDDRVYLCGHNSTQTAGANSYLLRRPDGTVMMVDTPRWSAALATRYEALGHITDVLLTHRDHAAHGRQYADRFGARLWIHERDRHAAPDADQVVRGLEPVEVGAGVTCHPLPGHTMGSVLYLADDRYLFTGDSLYWSRTTADIEIHETVVWYSVTELARSLARTVDRLRFEWLLPGHGDRNHLPADDMARRLRLLTARTQKLGARPVDVTAVRW